MSWSTPKTDWYGVTNNGVYSGDRFNAADYNRIKNNIQYLRDMAVTIYPEFDIDNMGDDKTPSDYFYADEINQLEKNLDMINANTLNLTYGTFPTYVSNGNTMDFAELNRLEGATLDMFEKIKNRIEGRRKFQWNFGIRGGL